MLSLHYQNNGIMAANLFNRYVWLLDLVGRHNGITFEQINEAWLRSRLNDNKDPLPKRTFHNHIQEISSMFDIEIGCRKQGGYEYYIKNSDGGKLSEAQEALLNQLRISNAMMGVTSLKGRILFDKTFSYKFTNPLLTAMEESRRVKLVHIQRVDEEHNKRTAYHFEPYFIKQYREWFVIGRVVEDNTIRIFSFNHISYISLLDDAYVYPEDFSVAGFLDNIPLLIEEGTPQIDDREAFALCRLGDMRFHRSCNGGFIPDEVIK